MYDTGFFSVKHHRMLTLVVDAVLNGAKQATKFVSPKLVIRAVRVGDDKYNRHAPSVDISVKIGKPNYAERKFIKRLQKAGEPFPVKKIQLKFVRKGK